jgi:hypothetical protein
VSSKATGCTEAPSKAEDAISRQGQQDGGVGGHDELRLAVAGGAADDVSQFHLPPRRKSAFGLVEQIQAFHAVAAAEERPCCTRLPQSESR